MATASPTATLQQRQLFGKQVFDVFKKHPETDHMLQMDIGGQSIDGMILKPWEDRDKTANELLGEVQQEVGNIAGLQVATFQPPPLPSSGSLPIQFVIGTTEPFPQLNEVATASWKKRTKAACSSFWTTI